MIPVVKYKTTRSGMTFDQIEQEIARKFAEAVLEDHKLAPNHWRGQGRNNRTPFDRTGELVAGFYFKPASKGARKTGLVGTIRAPASRFASGEVRDKFVVRLHALWDSLGLGYSQVGR